MNIYEFKNHRFEISEAKKRFLLEKFAEERHKINDKEPEYIYQMIEKMIDDHQIPLKTPLKSFDNKAFVRHQKHLLNCSPAIALDWVAAFVSHVKKVTNLDSPRILQVFADNDYLQQALNQCSIKTISYQQDKRFLFSKVGTLPYRTAESSVRKHYEDIDIVLVVVPFPRKEHFTFAEKYSKFLKGKYVFVLCANKPPFAGFQISGVLGEIHRKVIKVNEQKTPLILSQEHKVEFYDLVSFSKFID
jgi:hypothetical protein